MSGIDRVGAWPVGMVSVLSALLVLQQGHAPASAESSSRPGVVAEVAAEKSSADTAPNPAPDAGAKPSVPAEQKPATKDVRAGGKSAPDEPGPFSSGLTETAGVSLTLLDVEVVDRKGKPVRGLKKEDFAVELSGKDWPVYSVDDLCSCSGEDASVAEGGKSGEETIARSEKEISPGTAAGSPGSTPGRAAGRSDPGMGKAVDPERFVLYFDFSLLPIDGRHRALEEARRWIHEVKRSGDQVMVVTYAPRSGLRQVTPFTKDSSSLLGAIEGTVEDPVLQDPFPTGVDGRAQACRGSISACQRTPSCILPTPLCTEFAEEEYVHDRDSLLALKSFLSGLEEVPGRKSVILFQQNGSLEPAAIYPAAEGTRDLVRTVEQVGAEATLSRAVVNTAYTGDRLAYAPDKPWLRILNDGAVSVGANLADATGGRYNTDVAGLSRLTSQVRARCACIYRVGLQAPEKTTGRVFQAMVHVRGNPLPFRWRVQFLDDLERWIRKASSVLADPDKAVDLRVGGALIPLRASHGRWEVSVQLALDIDSIEFVPTAGGWRGAWEAGALLASGDGAKTWEMLSISNAHRQHGRDEAKPDGPEEEVCHEHLMEDLEPGRYRLAGFVRDRVASLFGGAQATLVLPEPRKDTLAGPVLLRTSPRILTAPLPIFEKRGSSEQGIAPARAGSVPTFGGPFRRGETLEALSWVCPRAEAPTPAALTRFVSKDGEARYRLAAPVIEQAGECFRITDRIETAQLEPSVYTYHLQWKRSEAKDPASIEISFSVESGPVASGSAGAAENHPP